MSLSTFVSGELGAGLRADVVAHREFLAEKFAERHKLSLAERRDAIGALAVSLPAPDGVGFSSEHVRGIDLWCATPDENTGMGALLYMHGGAFVSGSFASHRGMVAQLAKLLARKTYFVEYRLAPEARFPAALDDVVAAYRHILEKRDSQDAVAACGDSAGGNLALALLLYCREHDILMPKACVAISPPTDLTCAMPSYEHNMEMDVFMNKETFSKDLENYLSEDEKRNPYASPLFADLHELPPVLLQVGEHEVLLDDSRELASKIDRCNGEVRLEIYAQMTHVWPFFPAAFPEASQAVANIAEFLSERLR